MKVAQVVSTFPPYKGGMGNVAFHYSLELSKLGHDVTVYTPRRKRAEMKMHNFTIAGLSPLLSLGNASVLIQLLWRLNQFDVVHLHYPFFGSDVLVALAKRLWARKVKLVITYEMDVVGEGGWRSQYFAWHKKYLMPWVLSSADKIIVTSYDYAQSGDVADFLANNEALFTEIPLGANVKIFHPRPERSELRQQYGIGPDEPIMLFVAALDQAHYFKGLHLLLEAMGSLAQPAHLLVVGRGPLQQQYQKLANQYGISDRVHFVGYVSDFDLADYYNLCDVFVLPSTDKSEAFGLVYVEAMACAKPVIGSRLAGVRTVIDDGTTGFLIDPGNVADLRTKIEMILTDQQQAAQLGQAGLEKVQQHYTWRGVVEQIDQLYRSLFT